MSKKIVVLVLILTAIISIVFYLKLNKLPRIQNLRFSEGLNKTDQYHITKCSEYNYEANSAQDREVAGKIIDSFKLQDIISIDSIIPMDCDRRVFYESGTGICKREMPDNLRLGLDEIETIFSEEYHIAEFCKYEDEYYITILDNVNFPFPGPNNKIESYSIAKIDKVGTTKMTHNIEVTKDTNINGEIINGYCSDIVGLTDESKIMVACGKSSLIEVDLNTATSAQVNHCADTTKYPPMENPWTVKCYDENNQEYYSGDFDWILDH